MKLYQILSANDFGAETVRTYWAADVNSAIEQHYDTWPDEMYLNCWPLNGKVLNE